MNQAHTGQGPDLLFKIKWRAGDTTWLPHDRVSRLEALKLYLQTQNVSSVAELKRTHVNLDEDPQVSAQGMRVACRFAKLSLAQTKNKDKSYISKMPVVRANEYPLNRPETR